MTKYARLARYLATLDPGTWRASFGEIEAILGTTLPASAAKYQAWWANESSGTHSQSQGWMSVGWRTSDLDLAARQVTFQHVGDNTPSPSINQGKSPAIAEGLSIARAKAGLALFYGVREDQIEITIRG